MNTKVSFIIDLLISISGSAITMYVAYLWKFHRLFEKYKYRNQKSAEKEIIKEVKQSKVLKVYAMCGSTFSDQINSNIAKCVLNDPYLKQYYLVSRSDNPNIVSRQRELPKGPTSLETKINNSINDFNSAKANNKNIEIRFHDKKVGFRLIILDSCLYLSQQENGKYGKDTEVQKILEKTPAYVNYNNYFDDLWIKYALAEELTSISK